MGSETLPYLLFAIAVAYWLNDQGHIGDTDWLLLLFILIAVLC
ncbi:Uncharacterised protein [Candidatus Norongarragalina meridionalis]|nr:Uncharacterised protein [Candidatus Norongarragalina meridionalis]